MSVQIHLSKRKKNRMIKFNTLSKLLGATALVGGMFLTLPQEAFATSAGQYCVGFMSSSRVGERDVGPVRDTERTLVVFEWRWVHASRSTTAERCPRYHLLRQ